MSKPARTFQFAFFALCLCLQIFTNVSGQTLEAEIKVHSGTPVVDVKGRFIDSATIKNPRNLSFVRGAAGIDGIGGRIKAVELFGSDGKPIGYRKLIDGEFLADKNIATWRYQVDLTPLKNRNAAAHVSWISGENGIVLPADILPENARSGKISVGLPDGWQVFSWDRGPDARIFRVADFRRAVFAVGKGWSQKVISTPDTQLFIVLSGAWHFTLDDAAVMAAEIYSAYRKRLGPNLAGHAQIIFSNFPSTVTPGSWEAETRGNTVTIITSDMPFRTQSLQRLHEQLRHELFHLWIPNGVNLTGNYDWFYEGFALYQSLKLAVALNRIRFEDFLDTLSRAHTIDSAQSQRMSLLQSSAARFSGANTQVYARGMLVAFLCDLALLERSRGKRSVENILEEVFSKYRQPAAEADGTTAVLNILKANAPLIPVVEKYVTGADRIEWTADLAAASIEDADAGPITTLRVKVKPNGRQKAILEHLGYNNWRKLSPSSR